MVDDLKLRTCESRWCGHGSSCERKLRPTLGADVNLAASSLAVFAYWYEVARVNGKPNMYVALGLS